jgi:hypothetical protein
MTLSEVDQLCSVLKDRYGKEFSHIAYNRVKEQYITLYLKVRLPNGRRWAPVEVSGISTYSCSGCVT